MLDYRLREIIQVIPNQCGFVKRRETQRMRRTLAEKHREKKIHMTFLNLEKSFDKEPRELIWKALRIHKVLE